MFFPYIYAMLFELIVVLPDIGDKLAYKHGVHFCQELNPYRNLVRYEKEIENYFALVCLGCSILIYRRIFLR
jgi:hypothetical protein